MENEMPPATVQGDANNALDAVLQKAAGELPEGYMIGIEVERGSGVVYWCQPDGEQSAIYQSESLASDVLDALSDAVADAMNKAAA